MSCADDDQRSLLPLGQEVGRPVNEMRLVRSGSDACTRGYTRVVLRPLYVRVHLSREITRNSSLPFFFFSCPCGSSRICKAAPSLASDSLTLLACLLLLLSSCSRVALGGGGGRQTPLDAWQGLGARQESFVVVSTPNDDEHALINVKTSSFFFLLNLYDILFLTLLDQIMFVHSRQLAGIFLGLPVAAACRSSPFTASTRNIVGCLV